MAVYLPFQILVNLFEVITKEICSSSVGNKERSILVKANIILLQN